MKTERIVASNTLFVAFAVAEACTSFGSSEPANAFDADASTEAGPTTPGADAAGRACPDAGGPRMVLVTAGDRSFCIDATEVTRAQYTQFLDTGPSVSAQPAACAWNKLFRSEINVPDGGAEHPMVGVDWCDAFAFCAWAGKRLCGGRDGAPLTLDVAVLRNPEQSEWMAACSRNGARKYPYGANEINGACNTSNDGGAAPVGSHAQCEGGYDGLFDMTGNVTEWENACNDSARNGDVGGDCVNRGGSFRSAGACAFGSNNHGAAGDWGIRCCATPR